MVLRKLGVGKRAEVQDMMIFVITIFILAIGLFIMMYIIPSITNGMRISGMNNTAAGIAAIDSMDVNFSNMINRGFMMLFVGLIMSVMITSFLVRTHPIFLFLYVVFMIVTVILAMYLGNAFAQLTANPIFSSTLTYGTFFTLVMEHIAEITIAVGALSIIIVFGKFSTYGGTQNL